MAQYRLDARNLLCPMPVIRVQDLVATLSAGDEVEVTCTDPGALVDVPAWCRINGHEIIGSRRDGDEVVIEVRVGA